MPLMSSLPRESLPSPEPSADSVPAGRHDLRILRGIRRIIRSIDQHSRWLAARHGVTVPQLVCLKSLIEGGTLTVKELADRVYLSPSTVVGIIDRLEARDYARRERGKQDRRQVLVHATDAGRELVENSPSSLQGNLLAALEKLPELERATLALSVERIVELLEIKQVPAAPILATNPDLAGESPGEVEAKN